MINNVIVLITEPTDVARLQRTRRTGKIKITTRKRKTRGERTARTTMTKEMKRERRRNRQLLQHHQRTRSFADNNDRYDHVTRRYVIFRSGFVLRFCPLLRCLWSYIVCGHDTYPLLPTRVENTVEISDSDFVVA